MVEVIELGPSFCQHFGNLIVFSTPVRRISVDLVVVKRRMPIPAEGISRREYGRHNQTRTIELAEQWGEFVEDN